MAGVCTTVLTGAGVIPVLLVLSVRAMTDVKVLPLFKSFFTGAIVFDIDVRLIDALELVATLSISNILFLNSTLLVSR